MASEHQDNPEWTDTDFALARPAADVLPTAFVTAYRGRGRPKRSLKPDAKQQITLRLGRDMIERFRATGQKWKARINEVLRRVGLKD